MKRVAFSYLILFVISFSVSAQSKWTYDTVAIGGINQVIATKGNPQKPLLLFLHGGPGSSRMNTADKFTDQLLNDLCIVMWDQRESGLTQKLNKTNTPISFKLMTNDTRDLIDTLLRRYDRKKLFLAGESWGTSLGFQMVKQYPDKLFAYMSFGSVVHQSLSEELLLEKMKTHAVDKQNKTAIEELNKVKIPFTSYEQMYYLRKWWFDYNGQSFPAKDTAAIKEYLKDWSATWLATWNEVLGIDLTKSLPVAKCPVYIFAGGTDQQTSSSIAKSYEELLKAPQKKLFWYEKAGHDVLITESPAVQQEIKQIVLTHQ
jgi:pimeloyl-ACP methyl ester carboxylesterase